MADPVERDDWQAALQRWRQADLIDSETERTILEWESDRDSNPVRAHGRVADVAAYLGVSIVVIAALILATTLGDGGWGSFSVAVVFGLGAGAASWRSTQVGSSALADAFTGAAIVLVTVGFAFLLEHLGDDDQLGAGWLLLSLIVAAMSLVMFRLARARLAIFALGFSIAQLPVTLAIEADGLRCGIYGDYLKSLDGWQLWTSFVLVILMAGALLWTAGRIRRWLDEPLAVWARLGVSLSAAIALLGLAGASTSPLVDWFVLLAGWAITAWALRDSRAELLPASAVLLVGALAGGMSDFDSGARLGLTILALLTAMELTALGVFGSRLSDGLAGHWVVPYWESVLLIAGISASASLAESRPELAALGIAWAMAVLVAGVVHQRRLAFAFGAIGVYATLLTLVVDQLDSSVAAATGTLAFGLLVILVGVIWRRHFSRLTLLEDDS